MKWDDEIDARGLLCPLPVLKAAKRLRAMPQGAVLRLVADDPAAIVDVPNYCRESGNEFVGSEPAGGADDAATAYCIRRA